VSGTDYTLTPILGLYKPIQNMDVDQWGNHINHNTDVLDKTLLTTGGTMSGTLNVFSRVQVYATNAQQSYVSFETTDAPTDQKYSDITTNQVGTFFRLVNDAYNAATTWLSVSRTGYNVASITLGGPVSSTSGLSFGQRTASSTIDLAQHISLYDGWGGFNITSGALNVVAQGALAMQFGSSIQAALPLMLAADPTAALQSTTKQYSDRNKTRGLVAVTSNAATMTVDQADYAYIYIYGSPTAPSTITMPVATTVRLLWTFNNTTSQPCTIQGTSGGTVTIPSTGSQAVWTDTAGIYPLYSTAAADPTIPMGIATKQYADKMLPLAGGTMSGSLHAYGSGGGWSSHNIGQQLLVTTNTANPAIAIGDANATNWWAIANMSGVLRLGAMPALNDGSTAPNYVLELTGTAITADKPITLPADPTTALQAATKQYADTKLPLAGGTMSGDIVMGTGAVIQERQAAVAASAIDVSSAAVFTRTISGATTFTVSNVPAAGVVSSFILELTNASTNVTWWANIRWAGGTAPTLSTTGVDVLGFYTADGGTNWRGLLLGKGMA
jgi:hypothetical protein